jgi:hypothetical protein
MKHIKKFNESEEISHHEVGECILGSIHTVTDTNATFVIDGEEYSFTIRETGDYGSDYECEFLPDHDLPFELTEELKDQMFRVYDNQATR